jgi:GntR family carbon starvation induced transcriptional regulator
MDADASTPAAPSSGGKRTQASHLLSRLRTEIVCGRLPPGERLVIATLAEAFDAGQTPIREALMRLASEGFVTLEDQRGFSVAPVSREELVDLTATRAEIDGLAIRASIECGDDHWEAAVLGAFHRLQKINKIADDGLSIQAEWEERHKNFHSALVAACPNKVLLQLRAMLYERADRYRRLSVRYLRAPRDDRAEHEAIMKAALARDVAAAEQLLKAHTHCTAKILLDEIDLGQQQHAGRP